MKLFFLAALVALTCSGFTTDVVSSAPERIECASDNAKIFSDCMRKREQALLMRVEAAFGKALNHGEPSEQVKQALYDEQEAWRAYLDKACTYFLDTPTFGREGMTYHYKLCRTKIIEDRATKLEVLFNRCGPLPC